MRRRALLSSLGVLATGCLGSPSATESGPTTGRPSTSIATASQETTAGPDPSATATTTRTTTRPAEPVGPPADEYRVTNVAFGASYDRPPARYVLEPSAFYSGAAVEAKAARVGEEQVVEHPGRIDDPAVREAVITALEDGEWRANRTPTGLVETVERVDFFIGYPEDGTHTHVGLELHRLHPDRPPVVAFDATLLDDRVASGDPGVVELALVNVGRETQEVFSGTVPPFGPVYAEAVLGGGQFLLWRPYESEGCVNFHDRGMMVCAVGKLTPLEPGQGVARRYEVLTPGTDHYPEYTVPPGTGSYRVADTLEFSTGNGEPETTLSYEVRFDLTAAD